MVLRQEHQQDPIHNLGFSALAAGISGGATHFPDGTVIVERRALPGIPGRTVVLWMIRPDSLPHIPDDEPYTCPDETHGDALHGPTRVSLLETGTGRIVNTIEIRDPDRPDSDAFDLPRAIRPGHAYRVDSPDSSRATRPTLLDFRDYTGEGDSAAFALFEAPACMGLQTALVGYSRRHDRILQIPVELTVRQGRRAQRRSSLWLEYGFARKPVAPGHHVYDVDYTGRGGDHRFFDLRYDRRSGCFRGTCLLRDR